MSPDERNDVLRAALEEAARKQTELDRLSRELEDTTRAVVALYAELEEKAEHLRRGDDLKSRLLSNMTHAFRTPVHSIVGLCNLLVDDRRRQGLEPEQEIVYIRQAADQLSDLVNDLLDLARVEAGTTTVRQSRVDVPKLFGALRGMLRPLHVNASVRLVFDDASGLPPLWSDEGKLSQILRNLVSNALKFTERGEVRVSAAVGAPGAMRFAVTDTGIGIAPADRHRIFDEFAQVEHRLQAGDHGTGLGLPLARRLAEMLGGTLTVTSEPGAGSTFELLLPIGRETPDGAETGPADRVPVAPAAAGAPDSRLRVLTIDDDKVARHLIRRVLQATGFDVLEASGGEEGLRSAAADDPDVILLDLVMPGVSGTEVLRQLRGRGIPVIVITAGTLEDSERAALLEYAAAIVPKRDVSRESLPLLVQMAAAGRLGTPAAAVPRTNTPKAPRD